MSQATPFIGRQKELSKLKQLLDTNVASLVVIKGRRQIGKTRLAMEFGSSMRTVLLSGLAPSSGITAQTQRDHVANLMSRQLGTPLPSSRDWNDLFWHLSHYTQKGRILIVLDEISWMGMGDESFLGKLKSAWDFDFKKNHQLILMLTGSISSWIDENILASTGFVGRITLELNLKELSLDCCNEFWRSLSGKVSAYEKFKFLSVTGGVPRYLEELVPRLPAEENIARFCFQEGGLLVKEFKRIFSDLFQKRSPIYRKIVERLADGPAMRSDICDALGIERGGRVTEYLADLESAGFISQDVMWDIKASKALRTWQYRLKDNYLRFYLKYIGPNLDRIEDGRYKIRPAQWASIFGLQFENLILSNRNLVLKLLHIPLENVVWDNPYVQRASRTKRGCQIDYLVQTRDRCLYLCEVKFSQNPIGCEVIEEVEQKIQAITLPRGFSIRPVLIHVNGVTSQLEYEEYFPFTIDFANLLTTHL